MCQRKVQEINEAFEILGDVEKRALYDKMLQNTGSQQMPDWFVTTNEVKNYRPVEIEKKKLIREDASKTKQTFQIQMARRNGRKEPFRVIGILPLEEAEIAKLAVPKKQNNFLVDLIVEIMAQRPVKKTSIF